VYLRALIEWFETCLCASRSLFWTYAAQLSKRKGSGIYIITGIISEGPLCTVWSTTELLNSTGGCKVHLFIYVS